MVQGPNGVVHSSALALCTPDDCDEAEHAHHVRQFLQRCGDRRIALNREKCLFAQAEVSFAGLSFPLRAIVQTH